MNWTDPSPPTIGVSDYDHTMCATPIGMVKIEWKGWKHTSNYDVFLDEYHIGVVGSLDDAKNKAKEFLLRVHQDLSDFVVRF